MEHVIITGGAGFLGSHLCDRFLSEGLAVTAVDNLVTGDESNLSLAKANSNFAFVNADVSEAIDVNSFELTEKFGLSGVLHFACPASPIDFDRIPFEILKVDSYGTFNTMQWALDHKARYVYASTSEIYGDPLEHPQREDYWGNVNSIGERACYDESKRFGEAVVSSAIRGRGTLSGKPYESLNGAMVRIFNTYGPRMRLNDGRVVPDFCKNVMNGQSLRVFGDGQQTRSFCYVSDLVEGIFRLFRSDVKEPVNIGNPSERTVLDLAENILKLMGSSNPIEKLPARSDDPKRRCPDISKAKALLDWTPRVDLEEGLQETIAYFREHSR